MKKNIILLISIFLLIIPLSIKAEENEKQPVYTDFKETLDIMGIEINNPDYKETNKQITIYLFYTQACEYTKPVLEYFNSITTDKVSYIKLRAYDVSIEENMILYQNIATFIGKETLGVPFYMIGEKQILGYNKDNPDEVGDFIKAEYNKKIRYDVLKEMKKQNDNTSDKTEEKPKKEQKKSSITTKKIITTISLSLGIIILITAAIILNKKKISNKKIKIKEKLKEQRKEKNKKKSSKHSKENKNDKIEEKNNKIKIQNNTNKKSKKTKEE